SKSRHLVIDLTGVKVYGEGEGKVRQHGIGKRRTWRKLHFCTDEATLEIISVVASTNDLRECYQLFRFVCNELPLIADYPGCDKHEVWNERLIQLMSVMRNGRFNLNDRRCSAARFSIARGLQ